MTPQTQFTPNPGKVSKTAQAVSPIEHALNDSFSSGNRFNEIILSINGNTYVGPLSQLFATGRIQLPKVFVLDSNTELYHVFQVMDDGRVIQRAAVSSRLTADKYMSPDRVCIYRNATFVKHDSAPSLYAALQAVLDDHDMLDNPDECVVSYSVIQKVAAALEAVDLGSSTPR